MLEQLRTLTKKLSRKGFVGPRYRGLPGKIRFGYESFVARRELVFLMDPGDLVESRSLDTISLEVIEVADMEGLEVYRADLEARWYPGLLEGWKGPFDWGERLFLGLHEGGPIAFTWVQVGLREGAPVYWGRVFDGEYRILRVGTAPEWRGRGASTGLLAVVLKSLLSAGASRVYVECYEGNIPSVKTMEGLGFRRFGRIEVLEIPGLRNFVRWRPLA